MSEAELAQLTTKNEKAANNARTTAEECRGWAGKTPPGCARMAVYAQVVLHKSNGSEGFPDNLPDAGTCPNLEFKSVQCPQRVLETVVEPPMRLVS